MTEAGIKLKKSFRIPYIIVDTLKPGLVYYDRVNMAGVIREILNKEYAEK